MTDVIGIKRRIGISKGIFHSMKKVLTSQAINIFTTLRLLKCYVWSTLSYGCESSTVSRRMKSQLEATEMWFLRRMLRIAWTDKVSNKKVLQRANTSRNLLKVIVNRQIRFVGHIMRKSQLEAITLTGMIEGKRARGRQRKTFMDWTGCHSLVGNSGRSMTYWKSVKNVMNIHWSPTSESDTALTLDWIDTYKIWEFNNNCANKWPLRGKLMAEIRNFDSFGGSIPIFLPW